MTKEDLLAAMEILIKGNDPKLASQVIWVLWMDHCSYKFLKGKVVRKDDETEIKVA
jgi:hypothetical protein